MFRNYLLKVLEKSFEKNSEYYKKQQPSLYYLQDKYIKKNPFSKYDDNNPFKGIKKKNLTN